MLASASKGENRKGKAENRQGAGFGDSPLKGPYSPGKGDTAAIVKRHDAVPTPSELTDLGRKAELTRYDSEEVFEHV